MKTISVILPINNPQMLSQEDLQTYQNEDYYFKLSYINTYLKELNSASDVAEILPLVIEKIQAAEKEQASAVIVYAFGDVGIKEGKELVAIPVMGLGKPAVHIASVLCRNAYTIIPAQIAHNTFIEALVKEESLQHKFVPASYSVQLNPAQIRGNPVVLDKLLEVASAEISEKNVDTFTLACGSFIGMAKPLERELKKRHKKSIIVIDPIKIPFRIAMTLA